MPNPTPSRLLASLLVAMLGLPGCDDTTDDAGGGDGGTTGETGAVAGFATLQGETDHAGIELQITEQTSLQDTTDETGAYLIDQVPVGTYTVTASLAGYTTAASSPFEVVADQTTTVPPLQLESNIGDLAGIALLDGEDDHTGIAIEIEGTSHTTTTSDTGAWSITGIEAGQYTVRASFDGYDDGEVNDVSVVADQETTVPTITLVREGAYQGDYTINSQLSHDAFQEYSGITGTLTIQVAGMTELDLPNLTWVLGDLEISWSADLESLDGLANLESVGESISVVSCGSLTSIAGLANLVEVGDAVIVQENPALESLVGLEGLSTVPGQLGVDMNDLLTDLTGLDNIASVGSDLSIGGAQLASLAGLEQLETVGNSLGIGGGQLTSLEGLDSLTFVQGWLSFGGPLLQNANGLESLVTVNWGLRIENSPLLNDLSGLGGLTTVDVQLTIQNNATLPNCEATDLRDQLDELPTGVCIQGNQADSCPNQTSGC